MTITFCAERLPSGGAIRPIPVNLDKYPHVLVTGGTNSGKSIVSLLVASKISLHYPTSKLWILDFKGDSGTFGFVENIPGCRYWKYLECLAGLEDYFSMFQERLSHDPGPNAGLNLLWIDEYPSFILNLPRKDAETAKSIISTVLMMGRSKRCMTLTTAQTALAELFSHGARINYQTILAMGNSSATSTSILGFSHEEFLPVTEIGGGHLLLSGTNQRPVQVPYIGPRGMAKMKADILRAVTRTSGDEGKERR